MQDAVLAVKNFSEESDGVKCPDKPQLMTPEDTMWVAMHVMSEMGELLATTHEDPIQALRECLKLVEKHERPKRKLSDFKNDNEKIAEQGDAAVDGIYYMMNRMNSKGINIAPIFDVVHEGNMRKRHEDGKFYKNERKVIKPPGFVEADVVKVIEKMQEKGSWDYFNMKK